MPNHASDREAPRERSPWSRPSVMLSGAFLLALVLLGAMVAVAGNGGRAGHSSPPASTTARSSAPAPNASTAGCSLTAGQQQIPSSGPPAARWGTVGSMQVPQNPAVYGPQRASGPWETCFADDPSGVLLAAINFYAESTTGEPASVVMARYAVGAPSNLGNNSGIDNSGPVQLAGYRYDSYTPVRAEVSIVFQGSQGRLVAIVTPMVWQGGDWKYVFPSGGQPSLQVIADLSGYVPWSDF